MSDKDRIHLVIVESPAKARTIGKYLGKGYAVAASVGHVRDLPRKELGVDVENGFEPKFETIRGKGKVIAELKKLAKTADRVILATDPDREGEAIAYHVAEQLGYEKNKERFDRVTFREITKKKVQEALASPGLLDMKRIEAQQARRILDRLVGYKVSPMLWRPIRPGLSAGRVQTVALRIICERENEIRAFVEDEYWSITAHLRRDGQAFDAKLHQIDGKAFTLRNEEETTAAVDAIKSVPFAVTEVKRRERRKNPAAPFTTSTLQQEAAKRLRFSAKRTMSNAQRLYEGQEIGGRGQIGLITYMRTDSTRVSPDAVDQARTWVAEEMGEDYIPKAPRLYGGKQSRAAQDAHEAVRPTDVTIHPSEAGKYLEADQANLYEMIWQRFVASQMSPAVYDTTTVDFGLTGSNGTSYLYRSTGSIVKFQGFTRLYLEATEAGEPRRLDDLEPLPDLNSGDVSELEGVEPKQHFTQPPPRYSEASLVKEMEKQGIGRPSTYAATISVIVDRGYVELEKRRFFPTDLGEVVSALLVRLFPDIFDAEFTSRMESELDKVEDGEADWRELLGGFYPRLMERIKEGEKNSDEIIKEILAAEGEDCDKCGSTMLVRWNRFGRFLGCSGYPECKSTRSLDGFNPEGEELGPHPELGRLVRLKYGPYGPYVELEAEEEDKKPKRSSLPKDKQPQDVDLEFAVQLLMLPRPLGTDPETEEEVVAGLGRFGPFVRRGKTFASLKTPDEMWTVTLEEAVELVKTKASGGIPLKEFGKHPDSGLELLIRAGRYGPYVTDGTTNATLPKGTEPEEVDLEMALDLLAKKAARGGKKGKPRKKKKK
ncbi:MAG: type I DNA topoisomerase [Gemmatimonadales bacterium]|jgi:DNA topoisomerase-1|nr:type I DNA topoisomerase [Gemmatimonadales bacterium]MDG2241016.1 type I DNA topoisomerase [Longimicrobiales bacterium]MBT3499705.1 type I DNA topoisomerase [Gemmatimonadales bacterium]MBT3776153.1 type I DNA topoisomerase [Gemmatimonadales bacterium]MBT3959386.1 type I DNA topoisomerase [Gemmatimonadales bacterium]